MFLRSVKRVAFSSLRNYDYARTNIKIAPTLGLRNLLSTRPGLIHSYHRPYHVFHHHRTHAVDVDFGKQNHKGMGNTNHDYEKLC